MLSLLNVMLLVPRIPTLPRMVPIRPVLWNIRRAFRACLLQWTLALVCSTFSWLCEHLVTCTTWDPPIVQVLDA